MARPPRRPRPRRRSRPRAAGCRRSRRCGRGSGPRRRRRRSPRRSSRAGPAANTVTNETRARPIISAAAVAAVRPGLRTAFSRASRPGTPRSRSSGRPTRDASGRTSRGLSRATPRKTVAGAGADQSPPGERRGEAEHHQPRSPSAVSAMPTTPRRRGSRGRLQHGALAQRGHGGHAGRAHRRRERGEDRDHGADQRRDDDRARLDHACRTAAGRSRSPRTRRRARRREDDARARSRGPRRRRPITSASSTTEVMIWRRLAPSARSIPNSRVRWATVIEKVLKIRKAATNSATPANISSAVVRKPMNSPMSSCWDWVFSSPVSACHVLRQRRPRFADEVVRRDALLGGDRDLVELALLAGDPLRLGQGQHAEARAAERVDLAERRRSRRACSRSPPPCRRPRSCRRSRSPRPRRSGRRSRPRRRPPAGGPRSRAGRRARRRPRTRTSARPRPRSARRRSR